VITYSYVTFSCVKKTLRYVPGAVDVILVEKTKNFTADLFAAGFFVVKDAVGCGEYNHTKL